MTSNVRSSLALFFLLFLATVCRADVKPINLLAASDGDRYWVCLISNDTQRGMTFSSVRERVDSSEGTWQEIALLQTPVRAMAAHADGLAVLTGDLDLRLVWSGGGTPLPTIANMTKLHRIGSDGKSLIVSATGETPSPTDGLYRFSGAEWAFVAALPAGIAAEQVVLGGTDGRIWLAAAEATPFRAFELGDEGKWTEHPLPTGGAAAGFVGESPLSVATRQHDGKWSVAPLPSGSPWSTLAVDLPSAVTQVGPTTRVLSTDDKRQISQWTYESPEKLTGPVPVAQIAPAANTTREWQSFLILTLLTLSMMLTMRPATTLPPGINPATFRLAPFVRRIAAGVIDAVPYLIAVGYVLQQIEPGLINEDDVLYRVEITLAGMVLYILHVTITEALFGRSLGKWIMRLRVVTYEGERPTVSAILLRNVLRVIDLSFHLPLLFIFLSPMRQRIGDLAARTIVVADAPKAPPPSEIVA